MASPLKIWVAELQRPRRPTAAAFDGKDADLDPWFGGGGFEAVCEVEKVWPVQGGGGRVGGGGRMSGGDGY